MTEEEQVVADIEAHIKTLPLNQQLAVKYAEQAIRDVIARYKEENGLLALAHIGAIEAAKGH